MIRRFKAFATFVAALSVTGCGVFGGSDDTEEPPLELAPIEQTFGVERAWSARVGKGAERLHLGLRLATDGGRIFAADHDGSVVALDAITGKALWSTATKLPLASGPAFGDGLLALGSSDGDVVVLDAADGVERWRTGVSSEVLATPAIGGGAVVVRSVDGRMHGLQAADGSVRWTVDADVPRLSLRGASRPAIAGDRAVFGLDDGTIVAVALANGEIIWQNAIAAPRGRTELERLADVDAGIVIAGRDVLAAGFQSRAALLSAETGQIVWAEELSTNRDLGVDWGQLYVTTADSGVVAIDRATGATVWRQDGLLRRRVSAPAAYGTTVVVGDFEGYLHWLATSDGSFVARKRVGDAPITAQPLVVGEYLYVLTDGGQVGAFRARTES